MKGRPVRFKKTKRLFVISTEGAETEPIYFQEFRPGRDGHFRLKILGNPNHKSNPVDVVQRLTDYERRERPGGDTEYWAIIDRDAWQEADLRAAFDLARERKNYHIAMSNPCFELWLWLHLKPNRPFNDRYDCQRSLETEWPGFSKSYYDAASLIPNVSLACERAESLPESKTEWPTSQRTEVFRLVRRLTGTPTVAAGQGP